MIKTDVKIPRSYTSSDILSALEMRIPVKREEIKDFCILKRSLNISDRSDIHYDMTVGITLSEEREAGLLKMRKKVSAVPDYSFDLPLCDFQSRPVVVGAGPAGLFSALLLSEAGARPIVLERGLAVKERAERVNKFVRFGLLDPECNVQFGEGGAGTFSDGKLKVGGLDKYKHKVLSEFVFAGANEDIMYNTSAHLGTDKLIRIVENLRERIISLGGEIRFSTKLTGIRIKDGQVVGGVAEANGEAFEFETKDIVLATGHSARDVFEMLRDVGACLEAKGFGVGVRIEHPREYINRLVYGENYPDDLATASYHLVTHLNNGRSVYSFCMCPGGTVVPASSEQGGIVTNGMSEYLRDADNSNAAFLVSVTPNDFCSDDPLSGIEFQRRIENKAFEISGSDYKAPAITMGDFLMGEKRDFTSVKPSYPIGTVTKPPDEYLPKYITDSLRESISDFDNWLNGFYLPESVLTGPETRTTSPVRVMRNEVCEAVGIGGLYPTGEGAGYAGGIVSSARDGLIVAEKIIKKYAK